MYKHYDTNDTATCFDTLRELRHALNLTGAQARKCFTNTVTTLADGSTVINYKD